MAQVDFTAELSRAYSDKLDAAHLAAANREQTIEDIADDLRFAWLRGSGLVESFGGQRTLAAILSEAFYDAPGNPLHEVIELVRDMANAGNARALALIERVGFEHAVNTVELEERQ